MSVLDSFSLAGQVALVTGVGRGLGQAMALALAEAGADVAGLYHSNYEATQFVVEALGRRFVPIQCDLAQASPDVLADVVRHVIDALGGLHVLVNNAGIIRRTPALEFSESDWDDVLQVNLKAVFFLSQASARHMAEHGGGKIINVASLLSYQGGITVPSYTASKHGVAGITRALANEWAPKHINVNAIAPGYFRTDNTQALQDNPQRNQAILERIPAGHWGNPDDLKGVTVFLASSASRYMHGAMIPVDGGWLAR
jgi:2-deoxy-D-gluconate 3-dehydrogenase